LSTLFCPFYAFFSGLFRRLETEPILSWNGISKKRYFEAFSTVSLARGQEEPKDIDLFILKKDPPYIGTDRIRELERLVQYTIATDFIVYTPEEATKRLALGDPFLKGIFKEGKVLYERK
jgi:hypothetical protein